jgi:beta-mannosidase
MRKIIDNAWTLEKTFDLSEDTNFTHAILDCEGLDTFASITLNGSTIAITDNQFRHYHFDVTKALQKGSNVLRITFDNAVRLSKERADAYPYYVCLNMCCIEQQSAVGVLAVLILMCCSTYLGS